MVQGLGFLSKKSWHTKNIANQEKVWIAEEREKEEKAKTAELAKQIQQEREDDELSKIAGRKKLDRGIGWMYTGYHKDSETAKEDAAKQAEEYLLGKEFAPAGKIAGDLDASADILEGVNLVVAAIDDDDDDRKPAAYQENSVAQRNEAFRMRHEDPMFAVSLQAVRKEKSLEQRKELYERAGITVQKVDNSGEKEQKEGKKRKKEHKQKKKSTHQYHGDSGDDSYDGRKRKRKRDSKQTRRRSSSRERSDGASDASYDRRSSGHHQRRKSSDNHRNREDRYRKDRSRRSRSFSRSYDSDDGFHSGTDRDRNSHQKERSSDQLCKSSERDDRRCSDISSRIHLNRNGNRKPPPPSNNDDHHYERPQESTGRGNHATIELQEGYGLQGGKSIRIGIDDLGPNRELVQRKKEERDAQRLRIRESASTRRSRAPAEKREVLRAMERDAASHAATRDQQLHRTHEENDDQSGRRGASFLHEMTQRAHGINSDERVSMSNRLRQKQNTNQSAHDDSFL